MEVIRGKLRLRLPRYVFSGQQKYIATGLEDPPENKKN